MKIRLSENDLHNIVKESINIILNEKRGLKSMKLYNILKQHGGFGESRPWNGEHIYGNFSELTDNDILGVMSYQDVVNLQKGHGVDHGRWEDNYGLDRWAKERGVAMTPNDRVETERMRDGMFLVYVERNADYDRTNYHQEGGFKDYMNKRNSREKNMRRDGKNSYQWNNKAAQDVYNNYNMGYKNWSAEGRRDLIDKARNHQDRWGNKV